MLLRHALTQPAHDNSGYRIARTGPWWRKRRRLTVYQDGRAVCSSGRQYTKTEMPEAQADIAQIVNLLTYQDYENNLHWR